MKTKTIHQSVTFKASPHDVYEALMDSKKHSKFTGFKASISREVGGKINAYGGYIEGVNVKLVPDKNIVQKWRGSDWPDEHYSTVTFELKKSGKGTKLIFTQIDVPEEHYEPVNKGWVEHYWDKMKETFDW